MVGLVLDRIGNYVFKIEVSSPMIELESSGFNVVHSTRIIRT